MAGLIEDHVRGRALTRHLVEANKRYAAGDASALPEIAAAATELVEFYPVHIEKEDHHFFKPCLEYFTDAEKAQMLADFDEFDRALIHAKYLGVVEDLERSSVARGAARTEGRPVGRPSRVLHRRRPSYLTTRSRRPTVECTSLASDAPGDLKSFGHGLITRSASIPSVVLPAMTLTPVALRRVVALS